MKLETRRLSLVPSGSEHLDALHALWTEPSVRRYLWDDEAISRETAANVIGASQASFREHGFGIWTLFPIGENELVGFAGLRHFGDDGEIELLYGLHRDHWGSGLATEASQAILDYAFRRLSIPKIHAGTDPPNVASLRVMDRLGFGDEHRREVHGLEAIYRSLSRPPR